MIVYIQIIKRGHVGAVLRPRLRCITSASIIMKPWRDITPFIFLKAMFYPLILYIIYMVAEINVIANEVIMK
jgi:hypothetical protein